MITKRRKILFVITLLLILCQIIYEWIVIFLNNYELHLTHLLAVVLFIVLLYIVYRDKTFKKSIIGTGIFLLLASANLISLTPDIETTTIGFGSGWSKISSPSFNSMGVLLFIIYAALNLGSLIEMYLDYKESKVK